VTVTNEGLSHIVLFITNSTVEEARKIAEVLLEQRKIACANIVPGVVSLFWWQDRIDTVQENLLIAKTEASRLNELVELVTKIHSYDVPEIIAMPIVGGNPKYLEWISSEVNKDGR